MEFSTFCFCNGKKFWHQLKCILKSRIQAEHWLKSVIQKTFVNFLHLQAVVQLPRPLG